MKMKRIAFLVLVFMVCGFSVYGQTHFYIVGTYIEGETEKPCYWVDGVERKPAGASDLIAVDGDKVYTATTKRFDSRNGERAFYWDAERSIGLPNLTGSRYFDRITGITASNGKVYVVGDYTDRDKSYDYRYTWGYYMVDGVRKVFDNDIIAGVVIEDGVIYTIGDTIPYHNGAKASWFYANGQKITLATYYSPVTGLAVERGKVYISGYSYNGNQTGSDRKPIYWIDGVSKSLSSPSSNTITNGIAVENGKVAVLGYTSTKSGDNDIRRYYYWVNDERKELPDAVIATGIAVIGGKVYITGVSKQGPFERGCYWIDGVRQDLPGNARRANDITVTR